MLETVKREVAELALGLVNHAVELRQDMERGEIIRQVRCRANELFEKARARHREIRRHINQQVFAKLEEQNRRALEKALLGFFRKQTTSVVAQLRGVGDKSVKVFDPDQLRDELGRWSSGGAAVAEESRRTGETPEAVRARVISSPNFKQWFGDWEKDPANASKVVDAKGEPKDAFPRSRVVNNEGKPLVVFHGTTREFTSFEQNRANVEADMGAGFYFTDTPSDVNSNYADPEGPDTQNKLGRRVDELMQEHQDDGEEYTIEQAKADAAAEQFQNQGAIKPVFLNIRNPAVIGGDDETHLTYESETDEQTGEPIGEPHGTLIDFVEALRAAGSRYEVEGDPEEALTSLLEDGFGDGMSLKNAIDTLFHDENFLFNDYSGAQSKQARGEVVRRALERMGFDGIIDHTPWQKWGKNPHTKMELNEDTTHYIAFKPTQIKSATGNVGKFDPKDPDIRKSVKIEEGSQPLSLIDLPLVQQQESGSLAVTLACVWGLGDSNPESDDVAEVLGQGSLEDIARTIREWWLRAEVRKNLSVEELVAETDAGHPVILDLAAWSRPDEFEASHFVVLVGSDTDNLYFMDPWQADDWGFVSREELQGRWIEGGAVGVVVSVVGKKVVQKFNLGAGSIINGQWDEEEHPRDTYGRFTEGGGGDSTQNPVDRPDRQPDFDQRAFWEDAQSRPREQVALERQARRVVDHCDKLLQDAVDEGTTVTIESDWESLDDVDKTSAQQAWEEANVEQYIDDAEQEWKEQITKDIRDQVEGDDDWLQERFVEWAKDQGIDADSAENAFISYSEINAKVLEFDGEEELPEGDAGAEKKQDAERAEKWDDISGDWEKHILREMETRIESDIEHATEDGLPEDERQSVYEKMSDDFQDLSDDDKLEYADEKKEITLEVPEKFEAIDSKADGFQMTKAIALHLQDERNNELLVERGLSDVIKDGVTPVIHKVWSAWKGSSTSKLGLALQLAAAEELGGKHRLTPEQLNSAEAACASLVKAGPNLRTTDEEGSYTKEAIATGKEIMKAHARACWEVSQYVLAKSGVEELSLYRGLMLDPVEVDAKGGKTTVEVDERPTWGAGAEAKREYTRLANLALLRNGAASTSADPSVANSWQGVGNKTGGQRVVVRITAPREAVLSLPCFGQNIHNEEEVVIAGTWWKSWDAWLDRAPNVKSLPVKSHFALWVKEAAADLWVIDLNRLEDGQPHWLSGVTKPAKRQKGDTEGHPFRGNQYTQGQGGGEEKPSGQSDQFGGGSTHRTSLLRDIDAIKFTDRVVTESSDSGELPELDTIEESLTPEENRRYEGYMENAEVEALNVALQDYEVDVDVAQIAVDTDWESHDIAERAKDMIAETDLSDEDKAKYTSVVDTWLEEHADNWGTAGASELRASLHESGAPREVTLNGMGRIVQQCDSEMQVAYDEAAASQRESAAQDWEWDSGSRRDARYEYLSNFWRTHQEDPRFKTSEPEVAKESRFDVWGKDSRGQRVYSFQTTRGTEYEIGTYTKSMEGLSCTTVVFSDADGSFSITGVGQAKEVFTKVTTAIGALVKHEDLPAINFAAVEESRQKLYTRIVKSVLAVRPEYTAFSHGTGPRQYYVVKHDLVDKYLDLAKKRGVQVEQIASASKYPGFTFYEPELRDEWFTDEGWIDFEPKKGGAGSGNFGHAGRPGQVGGSSAEGAGQSAGSTLTPGTEMPRGKDGKGREHVEIFMGREEVTEHKEALSNEEWSTVYAARAEHTEHRQSPEVYDARAYTTERMKEQDKSLNRVIGAIKATETRSKTAIAKLQAEANVLWSKIEANQNEMFNKDFPITAERKAEIKAEGERIGDQLDVISGKITVQYTAKNDKAWEVIKKRVDALAQDDVLPKAGISIRPDEWSIHDPDKKELNDRVDHVLEKLRGAVSGRVASYTECGLRVLRPEEEQRGYYSSQDKQMSLPQNTQESTIVHEFGHHLEFENGTIHRLCLGFLHNRIGDEELVPLKALYPGSDYKSHEIAAKDRFNKAYGEMLFGRREIQVEGRDEQRPDGLKVVERRWDRVDDSSARYCGKVYSGGRATEILSMGLQKLYSDPIHFAKNDPEYFKFVVGVLDGSLLRKSQAGG